LWCAKDVEGRTYATCGGIGIEYEIRVTKHELRMEQKEKKIDEGKTNVKQGKAL